MSDGALQAASLGSLRMAPFSAPFGSFGQTAIHLPRLAEPGRRRGNLAGEPVGRVQGPTLPIRVAMACCQIIALPVRLHLPSICLRADNQGAEGSIRFSQVPHPPAPARCAPCDPSALFANSAGQMQRVPVYRLTFASISVVAFDQRTMSCRYTRRPSSWRMHRGSPRRSVLAPVMRPGRASGG